MEYTEDQFTVWFDTDNVKPSKEGAYEVICARGNEGHRMWSYWDGKSFNSGWLTPDRSYDHKDFPHFRANSCTQPIQWRGLNFDPNAPKPKKGNKRKTMYVVQEVSRDGRIIEALATFKKIENAKNYASSISCYTRIEKIRFRTPEHD